jgi:hypothetical protein
MIVFSQNKMAAMWNDSRSSLLVLSRCERLRDLMIVFAQNKMAAMWNDLRASLFVLSL